jgi:hypothetical protein
MSTLFSVITASESPGTFIGAGFAAEADSRKSPRQFRGTENEKTRSQS